MKNACVRTLTNTYMMKMYPQNGQLIGQKLKDRKRPISSPFSHTYPNCMIIMCSTYTLTGFENCNKSNESVKIIAASDSHSVRP